MDNNILSKFLLDGDLQSRFLSILASRELVSPKIMGDTLQLGTVVLTPKGKEFLLSSVEVDLEFIAEYRKLFPTGRRGTPDELSAKFRVLFKEMPNVTPEDIIKATKKYMNTVESDTFCEKAGNFISKQDTDRSRRSTLREFLEQPDKPEEQWTTSL